MIVKYLFLCFSISLDPDDSESTDREIFDGLKTFLLEDLSEEERGTFFNFTLPCIAHRSLDLKRLRPPSGLHFSLQQQSNFYLNIIQNYLLCYAKIT